jgi:MFS transporter, DHA2 family, multidrug resistance protein
MNANASAEPLRGARLAITAVALASGTFMQVLDSTIANVSLPTIAGNVGVSTDDSTWVITAFAAANGVTVPLTGWLMSRFGVVRTFTVSVALFTVASFLCGVAWSLPSLVVFRLLQGAVSGPMIPGSQALLIMTFPPEKRGAALGLWSMTMLVGPVLGPILGGYICDNYHWGLIFLINVPVGVACALISWGALRTRETPARKAPIDVVGLLLLAAWVGFLQCALDLGKNDDWFNSSRIVVLAICAAVSFAAWVIWELTEARPIVDLGLFRHRSFTIGVVGISLGYALFFATNLLLPLWLQQQLSYTATWAGLVAAPAGAMAVILTPFVAPLVARFDARLFATLSFLAFAASYFMRAGYTPDSDFLHLMAPMLMQGVAMSMFFVTLLSIALDGIPPERMPAATGLSNFVRIIAGSFSVSLITTFWDRRESLHQTHLADASSPFSQTYQQALGALGLTGFNNHQAAGAIGRQLVGQSYLLSTIELFWICGWMSLGVIGLVWLARRPTEVVAAAAD